MQEFEDDYYSILGVEPTATDEEIRKAYIGLAKKLHPDRYPNDPEQRKLAQMQFAKVTRAHNVISDSEKRAEYDAVRILQRKKELSEDRIPAQPVPEGLDATLKMNANETTENINYKWADKHMARADDLLKRKRYQEAETAMKEAIRLVPSEGKYHNKLAEVYYERNWLTLAMTEVQTALRIDSRDSEAKNLEMKIKSANKQQEASRSNAGKKSFFQQLKDILTKEL